MIYLKQIFISIDKFKQIDWIINQLIVTLAFLCIILWTKINSHLSSKHTTLIIYIKKTSIFIFQII